MNIENTTNKYDESTVRVLKGLDAVRKRPGMYIGNTDDGSGLHHMVFEVVDNSIDEVLAGYCTKIAVSIEEDGSVSVLDNGRGIPTGFHKEEGKSAAEVIMTVLHAGSKFDNETYEISGGLHGVGISVVNALSETLTMKIYKKENTYYQEYSNGKPEFALKKTESSRERASGTYIRFKPSKEIFNDINFQYTVLSKRFRELAFLNPILEISLEDKRNNKKEIFKFDRGISEFIEHINKGKKHIHDKVISFNEEKNGVIVDISLQWNNGFREDIFYFTNNIPQESGGTHALGLKSGLVKTFRNYISSVNSGGKADKISISGEDCREGIVCVVSVKLSNPQFSSQTKEKLVSSKVRNAVDNVVGSKLLEYLQENPKQAKEIANKVLEASRIRESIRKAKESARKKANLEIANLPGKIANCQEKNPELCELFLVEGDSAGGSAKQARDRSNQAILPLKGKIMNVEKVSLERMLSSEEIGTLVTAIGCNIGNDYNVEKLRYHRIIIMTDADVDGAHIRTLLLTFFYRYMPKLIENGHVYIAQPPLYRLEDKKSEQYVKNNEELNKILLNNSLNISKAYIISKEGNHEYVEIESILKEHESVSKYIEEMKDVFPAEILNALIYMHPIELEDIEKESIMNTWRLDLQTCLNQNQERQGISYKVDIIKKQECFIPKVRVIDYGMTRDYILDKKFFLSKYYKSAKKFHKSSIGIIEKESYIERGLEKIKINDYREVTNWLLEKSKQDFTISRYKGLGEMNPSQLWETAMDPSTRCISRVTVENAICADEMFSILMGENVSSRRRFIEKNALFVENIDI